MKMVRIWVIFNKPIGFQAVSYKCFDKINFVASLSQKLFKDYMMAVYVMCLAVIDIVILSLYTISEAVRDELGVKLTLNRELPETVYGVS